MYIMPEKSRTYNMPSGIGYSKRRPMSSKQSKKLFTKTASKTNIKNTNSTKPKRGGYRL
tara:strand:- start:284 stop:460 length:177 start_codon:yes stop_codon:yes gene_type:complete